MFRYCYELGLLGGGGPEGVSDGVGWGPAFSCSAISLSSASIRSLAL